MAGSLHNLRKKPKHVRDNIAFGIAAGFTLVIALTVFIFRFDTMPQVPRVANQEGSSAFSTLLNQIQEQVVTVKESVPQSTEDTSAMPSVTGEWGLSAQNASSSNTVRQKEAAIMIVNASSSVGMSSTTATTSVLY